MPCAAQRIVQLGIHINPGYSWLQTESPQGISNFAKENKYSINFGLSGQYYLNKKIAIYSGLQIYSYTFQFTGSDYAVNIPSVDSGEKPYERQITGKTITEKTSVQTMNVPLGLLYEYAINRYVHIFGLIGPVLAFPLQNHISASGTFSYRGYYQQGNYTLENIPVYGFNSNVEVNTKEKLKMKFVSVHATVAVGILVTINKNLKFYSSVNYIRSVSPLIERTSDKYYISNEIRSFHSILENKNCSLNNTSIGIGFQKVLRF